MVHQGESYYLGSMSQHFICFCFLVGFIFAQAQSNSKATDALPHHPWKISFGIGNGLVEFNEVPFTSTIYTSTIGYEFRIGKVVALSVAIGGLNTYADVIDKSGQPYFLKNQYFFLPLDLQFEPVRSEKYIIHGSIGIYASHLFQSSLTAQTTGLFNQESNNLGLNYGFRSGLGARWVASDFLAFNLGAIVNADLAAIEHRTYQYKIIEAYLIEVGISLKIQ